MSIDETAAAHPTIALPPEDNLTPGQARALAVELLVAADAIEYRAVDEVLVRRTHAPIHDALAREVSDAALAALRAKARAERHPRWARFTAAFS